MLNYSEVAEAPDCLRVNQGGPSVTRCLGANRRALELPGVEACRGSSLPDRSWELPGSSFGKLLGRRCSEARSAAQKAVW